MKPPERKPSEIAKVCIDHFYSKVGIVADMKHGHKLIIFLDPLIL